MDDINYQLNSSIDVAIGGHCYATLIKVTGDSLLIHEFAYSLLIGLCSATSNMTGYSHLYHSMKLNPCSAPQRDVLSDKMVL